MSEKRTPDTPELDEPSDHPFMNDPIASMTQDDYVERLVNECGVDRLLAEQMSDWPIEAIGAYLKRAGEADLAEARALRRYREAKFGPMGDRNED